MLPTIAEAHELLRQAAERNQGPWVDHSKVAARAAQSIAARYPGLEPDRAYVLGLLHDIGRGAGGPGVADVWHILDGYRLMLERGFDDCARICITHSFPIKHVDAFASNWDCPSEEREFVQQYLDSTRYTAYDRLIQLCDALALPPGPCVLEKRLVDVALRHGFNALTLNKWRAIFSIEREFSAERGASIYTVLTGVVENTFDFNWDAKFHASADGVLRYMSHSGRSWISRDRWDALVRGEGCPVCAEVMGTGQDNREGYFVADLGASRLRLQREQHVSGWCVLLLRRHVREPRELPEPERMAFFEDMVRVGHALEQVYSALKINYSILGNVVPHMHAHIQPRFYGDPYPGGVVNPPPGQKVTLMDGEAREQILRIRAVLE